MRDSVESLDSCSEHIVHASVHLKGSRIWKKYILRVVSNVIPENGKNKEFEIFKEKIFPFLKLFSK